MSRLYKIHPDDNVAVALDELKKGEFVDGIKILDDIPFAHKVLLTDLKAGDNVIKYANPIGRMVCDAKKGSYIHEHNLKTNLSDKTAYVFSGDNEYAPDFCGLTFNGYLRKDGRAGTRNEIWIVSTVGCVSNTAHMLAAEANKMCLPDCDGIFAYTHPYGCSQMGDDQENTRKVLASLINHPNAGGVLVVSLGCENTNVKVLKKYLGNIDENRVKFLVTQDCDDEIEQGRALLNELYCYVKTFKRQPISIDKLVVGLKCGGSDALSGITANALCGRLADKITTVGATAILTETPEMFGAEHILMKRSQNKAVFDKIVNMINSFKNYFSSHNQVCYENPSPGNHDGGITTLEEKSLGCIQKGGSAVITDVLDYCESVKKSGLNLLSGPGNDIVSTTNLTCAGANIILFTTGRGTPLGAPVPTVKISSGSHLFNQKSRWIDFNAQDDRASADRLLSLVIDAASGNKTKNEINNYRQIAIFKDGVVL